MFPSVRVLFGKLLYREANRIPTIVSYLICKHMSTTVPRHISKPISKRISKHVSKHISKRISKPFQKHFQHTIPNMFLITTCVQLWKERHNRLRIIVVLLSYCLDVFFVFGPVGIRVWMGPYSNNRDSNLDGAKLKYVQNDPNLKRVHHSYPL